METLALIELAVTLAGIASRLLEAAKKDATPEQVEDADRRFNEKWAELEPLYNAAKARLEGKHVRESQK